MQTNISATPGGEAPGDEDLRGDENAGKSRALRARMARFGKQTSPIGGYAEAQAGASRLDGWRRTAPRMVGALVLALGLVTPVAGAHASPQPTSGPTAGGTKVSDTVDGVHFTQLSGGGAHSVAIGSDRNAYAWGSNLSGQLGDGSKTAAATPVMVRVPDQASFVQISAGGGHTMAIDSHGVTWAWGGSVLGELGDGTNSASTTPVKVKLPSGVTFTQVSAGDGSFTTAIGSDGHVYAWGSNGFGQLGNGDRPKGSNVPVQVRTPDGVTFRQVSAGNAFAVALDSTGNAYSWGSNRFGNLGDGSSSGHATPVKVQAPAGTTFTQVSAGGDFAVALASDGHVYAWGSNESGSLGNGSTTDSSPVPEQVSTPAGVSFDQLAAGSTHALARATDGSLYGWGSNEYGQLADATSVNRFTPVKVHTPAGMTVTQITAGDTHSLALASDGNAYAWGLNYFNQLGDGTAVSRMTPVQVKTAVSVTSVLFGDEPGTDLTQTGDTWTVLAPPGCGPRDVTVSYTQFGVQHQSVTPKGFTQGTAPVVTTQPRGAEIEQGSAAEVSAAASGDGTPLVQWQQAPASAGPWSDIAGATATSTTVSPVASTWLRAVFTNCLGQATSDAVVLTPTMTQLPPAPAPVSVPAPTPVSSPPATGGNPDAVPSAGDSSPQGVSSAPSTPAPVGSSVSAGGSVDRSALGVVAAVLMAAIAASAVAMRRMVRR